MKLSTYLDKLNPVDQQTFAKRCGTSVDYLKQIASGTRRPGAKLAVDIERESLGAVPVEELLPEVDWAYLRAKAA